MDGWMLGGRGMARVFLVGRERWMVDGGDGSWSIKVSIYTDLVGRKGSGEFSHLQMVEWGKGRQSGHAQEWKSLLRPGSQNASKIMIALLYLNSRNATPPFVS